MNWTLAYYLKIFKREKEIYWKHKSFPLLKIKPLNDIIEFVDFIIEIHCINDSHISYYYITLYWINE